MKAAVVFLTVGGGLLYYFQSEKAKVEKIRKCGLYLHKRIQFGTQ